MLPLGQGENVVVEGVRGYDQVLGAGLTVAKIKENKEKNRQDK
jgi:hypothetical protein